MPKQSSRAQHPSSPGLAGAASVDEKRSVPPDGDASDESRERVATVSENKSRGSLNGNQPTLNACECWPRELDQFLKNAASTDKNHERASIAWIHQAHPGLSKAQIWERIVYLGLTNRKRPPYEEHEWTEVEDDILRAQYGDGRNGAHSAVGMILALHPDWSRDTIAWRAQVLGVANHRTKPTKRWTAKLDEALRELADRGIGTIAIRLGLSHKAVSARLRRLGFDAGFFGGQKTKDLMRYLSVSDTEVNAWVHRGWLVRKRARITDDSLSRFCREHADLIPFERLTVEARNWVRSLGYRQPGAH